MIQNYYYHLWQDAFLEKKIRPQKEQSLVLSPFQKIFQWVMKKKKKWWGNEKEAFKSKVKDLRGDFSKLESEILSIKRILARTQGKFRTPLLAQLQSLEAERHKTALAIFNYQREVKGLEKQIELLKKQQIERRLQSESLAPALSQAQVWLQLTEEMTSLPLLDAKEHLASYLAQLPSQVDLIANDSSFPIRLKSYLALFKSLTCAYPELAALIDKELIPSLKKKEAILEARKDAIEEYYGKFDGKI